MRNLIEDIGGELGCGAYVSELRRLAVGHFKASQMLTIEQLQNLFQSDGIEAIDAKILPPESMSKGAMH